MWLSKTAEHIYDYRNSIYGILDAVGSDYAATNIDIEKITNEI